MERPSHPQTVGFGGFTLDLESESLFRGGELMPLRPKAVAILVHLASRRPRLVTKEELLAAVWPDAVVGEWVLTTAVKELRQALGDDPRSPAIIETVHRRGYRFIAPTTNGAASEAASVPNEASIAPNEASIAPNEASNTAPGIVGRGEELALLENAYRSATTGRRQVVFVVGEAGIGKTALVDSFLSLRAAEASSLVAHGQSLEQFSAAEPYLPLLDAFGRITDSEQGLAFSRLLARLAPSWRGLLPAPADSAEPLASAPAPPERMLREMVSAIEATGCPLVLVLEDLHWSDYATLDVVNRIARGRTAVPVMVVVTYRAAELAMRDHPLKTMHRELRAQSLCRDLWLPPLAPSAIADYVARRFSGLDNVSEIAGQIARRTDGNALFVVNVTDELESTGAISRSGAGWTFRGSAEGVATAVPPGLRQLLAMRMDRLDESERDLLEASSVAGRTFCAGEVAAAVDLPVHEVDAALASVARHLFVLREAGESVWPDGSVSGRYEFAHSLYRDVLLELAPPSRRRLRHERIGRRMAEGFRGRTAEVATSLARHLEAAALAEEAIPFLEEAAERAWHYGAEREAVSLLERAITILESLARTPERMLKTIRLSMQLGQVLQAKRGFAHQDSETAFTRAWTMAEALEDPVQLFQAGVGLISSYVGMARFDDARRIATRIPGLMEQVPLPAFVLTGHLFLGMTSYHSGSLVEAQQHFDAALAIGEIPQPAIFVNFQVVLLSYRALALMHQGKPEEALATARLATRRAESETPFLQAAVATWTMFTCLLAGDVDAVEAAARIAETIGTENDYPLPSVVGRFGNGWIAARRGRIDEGLEAMQRAIVEFRASGQATALPAMLSSMAAVVLDSGRPEAALDLLAEGEALIRENGEVRFTAEVLRLQGESHEALGKVDAAVQLFERAATVAHEQGALWWESRALASLESARRSLG